MTIKRRALGVVLASAIVAGPWLTAPSLADDRVVTGNLVDGVVAEQIDTQRPITLTLQKTASNPYDDVDPGELPSGLISGITFTVYRVNNTDVTTSAGYNEAKKLTVDMARERGLTEVGSAVTNDAGKAAISGLEPGLYLVTETAPNDPTHAYSVSRPFLAILPLGTVEGTQFTYDSTVVVKGYAPGDFGTTTTYPTPPPESTSTPRTPPPGEPGKPSEPGKPDDFGTTTVVTPPPSSDTPWIPGPPGSSDSSSGPGSSSGWFGGTQNPSENGNIVQRLANTGAGVIGMVLFGLALLIAGVLMMRRRAK